MLIQPELQATLKRLRLSGMLATLPDRLAFARQDKLDYTDFLQLVLSDEIERRDHKHIEIRLHDAGFDEECTLERFDWSAQIRIDKARSMDLFGLRKLSGQASSDFYDLVVERHTRAATIITSNRAVDEWMAVFDEPLLGQSALDRFCHRAHQFVIDGESYRKRTAPSGKSEPPK